MRSLSLTLGRPDRWRARLVLAVLLLAALAPTVSRTLVRAGTLMAAMVVCTSAGPQRPAPDSSSAPAGAVLDVCPLCVLGSDRWAPPPHTAPCGVIPATAPRPDAPLLDGVRVGPQWFPPPRGPPMRSRIPSVA